MQSRRSRNVRDSGYDFTGFKAFPKLSTVLHSGPQALPNPTPESQGSAAQASVKRSDLRANIRSRNRRLPTQAAMSGIARLAAGGTQRRQTRLLRHRPVWVPKAFCSLTESSNVAKTRQVNKIWACCASAEKQHALAAHQAPHGGAIQRPQVVRVTPIHRKA